MINVIATILILYLLYKLVFDFIVPVSRTTSQFKHHVSEMRKQQEEQMRAQQQSTFSQNKTSSDKPTSDNKNTTTTDGEYIDFEEVK